MCLCFLAITHVCPVECLKHRFEPLYTHCPELALERKEMLQRRQHEALEDLFTVSEVFKHKHLPFPAISYESPVSQGPCSKVGWNVCYARLAVARGFIIRRRVAFTKLVMLLLIREALPGA